MCVCVCNITCPAKWFHNLLYVCLGKVCTENPFGKRKKVQNNAAQSDLNWILYTRAIAKIWVGNTDCFTALCLNVTQCPTQPFPKPCSSREPSFVEAAIIWKRPEAFSLFTFPPQFNTNFRAQGTIVAPVTLSSAENSEWILPKIQAWNPSKWSCFARLSKPTAATILRWQSSALDRDPS